MAKRKRKKSGKKFSGCKVVSVNRRRRKLCWKNGKLTSNKKA